jgi:hypothetical protein
MKYFSLLICAVSFLTGCNNVTYTTNIDDDVLSEHVSSHIKKRGLEQFYSVQDALDRGASPLGGIKGESCDVSGDTQTSSISYNRLKSQAIESLKNDVLYLGGNAFTLDQCQSVSRYNCDLAVICTGQAYNY